MTDPQIGFAPTTHKGIQMQSKFTEDDLYEAAAESVQHARLCLEQAAAQEGREPLEELFEVLANLESIQEDTDREQIERFGHKLRKPQRNR
jgi:hypothetical protein